MKVKRSDDLLVKLDLQKQTEIEENVEKIAPRDFFRGSEVGNCSKLIYFKRLGTPVKEIAANKARFLDDGHLHQGVLSKELQKAGIKVTGEEEEVKKQFEWKGIKFKVTMHKDGTVRVDGENQLLEVKSVKENRFQELMKTNDVSAYYDQIQMYLFGYRMGRCKLIIVDRNNSLRLEYTISIDKERVKHLLDKLARIEDCIQNDKEPKCDYPRNSKECGWCPYFGQCWKVQKGGFNHPKDKAEKAIEIEGKKEVKSWEVAIDLYRKYLRVKKEAKDYKIEADALMALLFTKFRASKIYGEGGSVSKVISSRQIPDKSVINEYIIKGKIPVTTMEQVSIRYSVGNGEEEEE